LTFYACVLEIEFSHELQPVYTAFPKTFSSKT
jgi:hypothetical protein